MWSWGLGKARLKHLHHGYLTSQETSRRREGPQWQCPAIYHDRFTDDPLPVDESWNNTRGINSPPRPAGAQMGQQLGPLSLRQAYNMPTTFEFVTTDPASNPKPGKSLQIRSRCMQGKNKREGSRRSQQEKRRLAKHESQVALQNQQMIASRVSPFGSLISDLAVIHFADPHIAPETKGQVFKAFAFNVANQALCPLDGYINFETLDMASFEWLFSDPAFLHSVLGTSYAVNDFMVPHFTGTPGRQTVYHVRETLGLLQVKMRNERVYEDESVMHVVINLALLAAAFGEWRVAGEHFKGLRKIVQLKGDLEFLRTRPKLHFKLDRIDLVWSLSSGKKPMLLEPIVSWHAINPAPGVIFPSDLYQPPAHWGHRLSNVFLDAQFLTLKINDNVAKRSRDDIVSFQSVLSSIQARLVHLGDVLTSPVEEMVRLTLMSFLTTTVKVPGRKLPYDWVREKLRFTYKEAAEGLLLYNASLRVWILLTIAFTVARDGDDWIKDAWIKVGLGLDWDTVKKHMMRVMWIEIIHDRPAEAAFQQLQGFSVL